MIYANFLEGDIYLARTVNGYTCRTCILEEYGYDHCMRSLEEVYNHLKAHKEAEHIVPERIFERIKKEMGES